MAKTTIQVGGEPKEFSSKKAMLKWVAGDILEASDGPMTLRQLHYRFVAKNLIDNNEGQYSYLGEAVKEARIDGKIPWGYVDDRTRGTHAGDDDHVSRRDYFENRHGWLKNAADTYELPRWTDQPGYVEVWVEKEALAGVFADACEPLGVTAFPCRGYPSVTALHEAAERLREAYHSEDRWCRILYFGDFDPSGQDIERNIRDELHDTFALPAVEVERVALNRAQIDARGLPPQPAKRSDSRYEDFAESHGDMAVELDAIHPRELREMIREEVNDHFDEKVHERVLERQAEDSEWIQERVDEVLGR